MTDVAEEALGRAAARGGLWGVAAEASTRASQSICFFVLAGVLSPKQFGAAAIAFVCVQVANSLTYAGVGAAVQVLGPDTRRDRTAVAMAFLMGTVGALLLAGIAGPLCRVLGTPEAVNLVRLVALALPLAQTSEVMSALLDRELRFRTTGVAVVIASVISATVGLTLAATGAGAAALVAQGVVQPGARTLLLAVARPALLRVALHRQQVVALWAAGKELLVGQVFATASGNVDNIVVSALAGQAALGGYGFAYNLTTLPFFLVGLAVGRVALPIYGALRARLEPVRPAFLTTLEVTAWLAALPLGFLAVAGPPALVVIFGHKWDPVSGVLRLLALHGWLRTVESTSGSVLIALGEASVMRRVQQWQLAGVLVLLVPLVLADGPLGAAVAVSTAVAFGTSYSLRKAGQHTGSPLRPIVGRLAEAAVGGAAGGAAGLVALELVRGATGLALGLLAATATWLAFYLLLRPGSVVRGVRMARRRRVPISVAAPLPTEAPAAVLDLSWSGSLAVAVEPRFTSARVLVRDRGTPLAWVRVALDEGRADDAQVRTAVLASRPDAGTLEPSPLPPAVDVSVVVCTVGRPEMLARLVRSLLASDHPAFEVLVVDNRPSDPSTRDVLTQFDDPRLRLVSEPVPGVSGARNRGIANSAAPLIAFTDDDVVVDPNWLRWLTAPLAAAEATVTTGLVLPLELETAAQVHFEGYGGFARGMVRRAFDLDVHTASDHLVYPFSGGSFGSGNSMAFTREALLSIDGFDPALGAGSATGGGEDIDAFTHLVLDGATLVYEPRAVCWHQHRREQEALTHQIFTYGTGFGAVTVKWVLRSSRLRRGLLRRLGTLLQALRPGRPGAARDRESPPELSVLELRGMLASPLLYVRARRWARRHAADLARL